MNAWSLGDASCLELLLSLKLNPNLKYLKRGLTTRIRGCQITKAVNQSLLRTFEQASLYLFTGT